MNNGTEPVVALDDSPDGNFLGRDRVTSANQ